MNNGYKITIIGLLGFAIGIIITTIYFLGTETEKRVAPGPLKEIKREIIYDTLTYRKPMARDSVVLRYETAKLPLAKVDTLQTDLQAVVQSLGQADSVAVQIPITQTEYADTTYRAWVSGYRAQLDSIQVFARTEFITMMQKKPTKRWGVGLQAGYGYTPTKGFQPYIGVGIMYSVFSF